MLHDFVVIGAGSAGAPLAALLSSNPERSVLLIEAGPDYASRTHIPVDLLDSRNLPSLQHDWNYMASPVPGRTMPYRRGKVIGGTSAVNAAAAQWGHPADFAEWVNRGNSEWSWNAVLPFFKKIESDADGSASTHGRNGPINISRYSDAEIVPIQRAFYDSCREAGIPDVRDHNAICSSGIGPWPLNRENTTRISTALAYLEDARTHTNLTITPDSVVSKLLFDRKRVVGVELANGSVVRAKNVVLAAGSIGSPAILMRSGIGPAEHLEALGIELLVNSPGVGAQLWDHPAVPLYVRPKPGHCVPGRDPRFQMMATFTAPGSSEPNDMQLVMTTFQDISASPTLLAAAGVPVVAALRVALMKPLAHGRLRLKNHDPSIAPEIELNYGRDPEDMRRLMESTRLGWRIINSASLKRESDGIVGLTEEIIESDVLLRGYINTNIGTYCHALGTARMGPEQDTGAVVDQYCRVRGVENVWIIDASVIPAVPRSVPNLLVIAMAERVAGWLAAPQFHTRHD